MSGQVPSSRAQETQDFSLALDMSSTMAVKSLDGAQYVFTNLGQLFVP